MTEITKKHLELLNETDKIEAAFREMVSEVSMGEYRVIAMVSSGALILKGVASQRSVSIQGVGRVVERLRRRGLLTVVRNERDKRAKDVSVSTNGQQVLRRCDHALKTVLRANP